MSVMITRFAGHQQLIEQSVLQVIERETSLQQRLLVILLASHPLVQELIDAYEAERIGLANKIVPRERLEATTMEFASKLAALPPFSVRKAKLAIYRAFSIDLVSELEIEADVQTLCLETKETQERIAKFVGKK